MLFRLNYGRSRGRYSRTPQRGDAYVSPVHSELAHFFIALFAGAGECREYRRDIQHDFGDHPESKSLGERRISRLRSYDDFPRRRGDGRPGMSLRLRRGMRRRRRRHGVDLIANCRRGRNLVSLFREVTGDGLKIDTTLPAFRHQGLGQEMSTPFPIDVTTGGYPVGLRTQGMGQIDVTSGFFTPAGLFGTGLFESSDIQQWGPGEWVVLGIGALVAMAALSSVKRTARSVSGRSAARRSRRARKAKLRAQLAAL